ncbi:MAG: SAM-dependent methyltransferase [Chloroflexi bacterium]|nr:SAM-dependent methyltransferase [Chloroflexota bacterium]MDA1145016.1 SAM-dependent methyltransferase [Chloroflexota bacterium]MQC82901.1 SAM-dependent methyltransferase [Chloroflexota bacterium]
MTQPPADDFALAAADTPIAPMIRAEIEAGGGRITFARFMDLALAHPEHGYYSREQLAWGRDGDYETSPEVHPIFGYLWARQIEECWDRLGRPARFDLVEVAAGSGAFSAAILTWLRDRSPDCFAATHATLLDGHPHRLEAQRRTLRARNLPAQHRLLADWLDDADPISGVVISNEFFDALPIHLVERRGDALGEWYVEANGAGFRFAFGDASTPALDRYFGRLGLTPGDECRAEVNLAAAEVMRRIASRVERGYVLSIDYGHEARDLYASWRRMGTLMAFRNHSPQPDPLASPGLLDLTAHVDFTTLAAAATDLGFEAAPTVSQAEALTVLGLPAAMQAAEARAHEDVARFAEERRAATALTNMEGLGRIRVLALAKGAPLEGLRCLRSMAEHYG